MMKSLSALFGIVALALLLWVACGETDPAAAVSKVANGDESATAIHELPEVGVVDSNGQDSLPLQRVESLDAEKAPANFRLLLFGASRGLPLSGVTVRACPKSLWTSPGVQTALISSHSPPREILDLESMQSGDDGVAQLPVPTDEGIVAVVKSAGRWHWQLVPKASPDQIIRMEIPDAATFSVRVVDQNGAPAIGVPLAVSVGKMLQRERMDAEEWRFSRAPDGGVNLSDLALMRKMMNDMSRRMAEEDGKDPEPDWPLYAWADLLFLERPSLELPLPATGGYLEFRLPPSGSLRVEVIGIENASGTVSIHGAAGKSKGAGEAGSLGGWSSSRAWVENLALKKGVLEVPYMGLGLDLDIRLQLRGESGERSLQTIGPKEVGQRVVATFEVEPVMAVSGRLLDSRGRPITGRRVERAILRSSAARPLEAPYFTLFGQNSVPERQKLELDENGNFRAIFSDLRMHPHANAVQIHFAGKCASWVGIIPIERTETNLGDLQLGSGPTLLAGRVVNPQGIGIEDVKLSFEFQVKRRDGDDGWQGYLGGETASLDDGSFRIPKTFDVASGRLIARHPVYSQAQPLPVQTGVTDLEVPMVAGGDLYITYRAPDGIHTWALHPVMIGEAGAVSIKALDEYIDGETRGFRFKGLTPGVYTVGFQYFDLEQMICPTEGVLIEAGVTNTDPRLQNIDLALSFREISIEVQNEHGLAIQDFKLYILEKGGNPEYIPISKDEQTFWVPRNIEFDIGITADGYAAALVEDIGTSIQVKLHQDLPIRLEVPPGAKLDFENGRLLLGLDLEAKTAPFDWLRMQWMPAQVDAEGGIMCTVPGPGRYLLGWFPNTKDYQDYFQTIVVITGEEVDQTVVIQPPPGLNEHP